MAKSKITKINQISKPNNLPEPAPKLPNGLWEAKGSGFDLHIEADSRKLAVALAEAYTGRSEAAFVFAEMLGPRPVGAVILSGSIDEHGVLSYSRG